jgi:GNAT superfamily N-acetyltransferase
MKPGIESGIELGIGERSERVPAPLTSVVVERDGYQVTLQPDRPDYQLGNRLILPRPPTGAELADWVDVWRREFAAHPDVRRMVLTGEGPEPADLDAAAQEAGLEVERDDILVLRDPRSPDPPPGVAVRPAAAGEWPAVAELDGSQAEDPEFRRWRWSGWRELLDLGRGEWWAAWRDDHPIASGGIFRGDGLARYQEVVVHPEHRRQGVAAALVGAIAADHRARFGDVPAVIVAESGSSPARIYRRLGFQRVSGYVELSGDRPD